MVTSSTHTVYRYIAREQGMHKDTATTSCTLYCRSVYVVALLALLACLLAPSLPPRSSGVGSTDAPLLSAARCVGTRTDHLLFAPLPAPCVSCSSRSAAALPPAGPGAPLDTHDTPLSDKRDVDQAPDSGRGTAPSRIARFTPHAPTPFPPLLAETRCKTVLWS